MAFSVANADIITVLVAFTFLPSAADALRKSSSLWSPIPTRYILVKVPAEIGTSIISPALAVKSGQFVSSIFKSNLVKFCIAVRNLLFVNSIFSLGNTGIAAAVNSVKSNSSSERWVSLGYRSRIL